MAKIIMDRRAGDNKYLHKDFHLTADVGLKYVGDNYGEEGIKEYLTNYTLSFYKLLIEEVKEKGLLPLKNYLKEVYRAEETEDAICMELDGESLQVKIKYCPAVTYMKSQGHQPCKWYKETTSVVYDVLAKACGYTFELISYNEENGQSEWKIWR